MHLKTWGLLTDYWNNARIKFNILTTLVFLAVLLAGDTLYIILALQLAGMMVCLSNTSTLVAVNNRVIENWPNLPSAALWPYYLLDEVVLKPLSKLKKLLKKLSEAEDK